MWSEIGDFWSSWACDQRLLVRLDKAIPSYGFFRSNEHGRSGQNLCFAFLKKILDFRNQFESAGWKQNRKMKHAEKNVIWFEDSPRFLCNLIWMVYFCFSYHTYFDRTNSAIFCYQQWLQLFKGKITIVFEEFCFVEGR